MNKYTTKNMKGCGYVSNNYFKEENFVRGYGFKGCGIRDQFRKFRNWITPLWKTHIAPKFRAGLAKVGTDAVTNVANDALPGKNVSESIANNLHKSIHSLAEAAESKLKGGGPIVIKSKKNKKKVIFLKKINRPDIYS